MTRLFNNNIFRLGTAGLALTLAFAIMLLSKAFAYEYHIEIDTDPSITDMYKEDGTIQSGEIISVNHAGKYTVINGIIHLTDDSSSDCAQYFTMSPFERGDNLPAGANMTVDSTTGEFSITNDPGLELSAGDEVLKTYYEISPEAPNGVVCKVRYAVGYTAEIDSNIEEWPIPDTGGSIYTITVDKDSNDIEFYDGSSVIDNVDKIYGDDDFAYTVPSGVTHGATISYASGNEDIATVNSVTGEVQIVGAGSTTITATAAPYYNYAEGTTSYTLNVAPKSISISDASVLDKTYDGTTDAEVNTVTLSDASLIQGVDYEATAVLDDANVGDNRTATVTVTLLGDAANNYTLTSNTFEVNNVTVEPYAITSANIDLEYYVTRYSGTAKEPTVTVRIGAITVDSNDYDVEYDANVDPGTATVTVTAKNGTNIASSASQDFEIIDKEVLEISGIATPQTIEYTGSPVVLEGTLAVGANTDGITVDDINIVWYEADGVTEISQPTDAGNYVVKYFYDGVNYRGQLLVSFEIEKAVSPEPEEMTGAGFTIDAGKRLADIEGTRTLGFSWENEDTIVLEGRNGYAATYTYNNDTTNYTTLSFEVVVYGESHEDEGGDTDTDTDDGVVDVPDTGRFTGKKSEVSHGVTIDTIVAIALVVVAAVLLLGGKFAKSKIDFDKK